MSTCTNQSILTLLKIQADRYPNKVFLFFKEQEVTYRQFFDRVEQVAFGLARFKIAAGDKIAICLPNCPESLFAFFGVLRRGAITVPMEHYLTGDEIAERLKHSKSHVFITTARLYASMQLKRKEIPQIEQLFLVGERGGEGFVFSSLYISGPKKFEMEISPDQDFLSDADAFVEAAQITEQDCLLYASPWLSSHRQIISIFASIIVGGSVILLERFSPHVFLNAVQGHHATAFFGGRNADCGKKMKDLFESEEAGQYNLSSLRFCIL